MSSPNPAQLGFMIDWACEAVLAELAHDRVRSPAARRAPGPRDCDRNPLPAFFAAGEAAFRRMASLCLAVGIVDEQRPGAPLLDEIAAAFGRVGKREAFALCGVCPERGACAVYQACAA